VIFGWVVILGITVSLMIAGGAKLSDNVSINGIPSNLVIEQLKHSFASASGGSAQIVFHKSDGSAFSESENQQISTVLDRVAKVAGVSEVLNPFTTQATLDKSRADAASGLTKLADGKKNSTMPRRR